MDFAINGEEQWEHVVPKRPEPDYAAEARDFLKMNKKTFIKQMVEILKGANELDDRVRELNDQNDSQSDRIRELQEEVTRLRHEASRWQGYSRAWERLCHHAVSSGVHEAMPQIKGIIRRDEADG